MFNGIRVNRVTIENGLLGLSKPTKTPIDDMSETSVRAPRGVRVVGNPIMLPVFEFLFEWMRLHKFHLGKINSEIQTSVTNLHNHYLVNDKNCWR